MTMNPIINVSEADFETEVLAYSEQAPVVVDFWAEWCGPCKILGPLLEKLALEAEGGFRLAKVDVDANQNLALRFGIHGIPAVKAFRNRAITAEFTGIQPEPRLREFLRSISPSEGDLALEKGQSLLLSNQPAKAETAFREALALSPSNPAAMLGLAKCFLLQGMATDSLSILTGFPPSREFNSAQTMIPLANALQDLEAGLLGEETPLDAAFKRAIQLVHRGNLEAAMDGLLDILREEKRYRDDRARLLMVALLELLGQENPLTRSYRTELASVLF